MGDREGGKGRFPAMGPIGEFPLIFSSVKYMTHSEPFLVLGSRGQWSHMHTPKLIMIRN